MNHSFNPSCKIYHGFIVAIKDIKDGKSYKIGYAIKNKTKWIRKDKKLKFYKSISKFDNKMREYGAVIKYKGKLFMFYNGNNYGEEGIGLAEYIN